MNISHKLKKERNKLRNCRKAAQRAKIKAVRQALLPPDPPGMPEFATYELIGNSWQLVPQVSRKPGFIESSFRSLGGLDGVAGKKSK